MSDNKRMRDIVRKSTEASNKIRDKVSNTSPGVLRYSKNVASSIAQATGDYFLNKNDTIREFTTINKQIFEDTSSAIMNPKAFIKKQIAMVVTPELKQATSNMTDAIISDLKTGKFYDRDRVARFDKSMDWDNDDSFGGFDFDDWGIDDDGGIDSGDEAIIGSQFEIAAKQDANSNARTAETVSAMGFAAEAIIDNDRYIASKNFKLGIANHNSLMGGISGLSDIMSATMEAQNVHFSNLNTMIEHSAGAISDRLDRTNQLLEEIKNGLVGNKREEEEDPRKREKKLFGSKGALNIDAYIKNIIEKADSESSASTTFTNLTAGMGMSEVINMFADNPLSGIYNIFLDKLLPKPLKDSMANFQKSLSSFARNLITKAGSKKDEGGFKGFLSKILGVEYSTYFDPQTESYNQGKYKPQNFMERSVSRIEKSVTEVLPSYLRAIAEGITGEKQKIFNYESGKFVSVSSSLDRVNRDLTDMYSDQYKSKSMITDRTNTLDMTRGRREDLDKSIDRLLQFYAKEQRIVDPFGGKPSGLDIDNRDWSLISGALRSLSDSDLQQVSADAMKAKQNLSERNKRYGDKLIDSGMISLFNEFSDKITDNITSESFLFRDKEYDPETGQFGSLKGDIEKMSGVNLSNRFLNDILERLTNGIIVFPYSGGKKGKGGDPTLDNLREKSFSAISDFKNQRTILDGYLTYKNMDEKSRSEISEGGYGLSEDDFRRGATSKEDRDLLPKEYEGLFRSIRDREQAEKAESDTSENRGASITKLRKILNNPLTLLESGFKSLDKAMFRIIFGKDPTNDRHQGQASFFDTLSKSIMGGFDKMINWFENKFQKAKDKGTEWLEKKGKAALNKGKDFLFAAGDEDGKGKGIFTDLVNDVKGQFNGITGFGSFKDSVKSGWKNKEELANTKNMNLAERMAYNLNKGVTKVSRGITTLFLGDTLFDEDGNIVENESQKLFKEVSGEFKGFLPKGIATAGIGAGATAGLGLLTGLALPGGPIFGAVLGATTGFISHSDKFREYLFGKVTRDKDGNEVVEKQGLFDREIVKGFKQFAPSVAGGVAIGSMIKNFGLFGTSILPGGPIMGGFLGGIAGMTLASKQMRELLFGEGEWDEEKQEWKTQPGLLDKKKRKSLLESLGFGAAGFAAATSVGLLGLPFIPGGPLFAGLAGIGTMLSKDTIKSFLFGETEMEEVDELDENGNPTGRKIKQSKDKDGLFGKIFKGAKEMVLEPVANYVNKSGKKIQTWFQTSIVDSFKESLSPLKAAMSEAGKSVKDSFSNAMSDLGKTFSDMFRDKDGKTPGDHFKENIMTPIGKAIEKMVNGIGKILASILSAPFKLLSSAMKRREDKKDKALEKRIKTLKAEERWDAFKSKFGQSPIIQSLSNFKNTVVVGAAEAQMAWNGEVGLGEDGGEIQGPTISLKDRISNRIATSKERKEAKKLENAKLKADRQVEYAEKLRLQAEAKANKAKGISDEYDENTKVKSDRKDSNSKLVDAQMKNDRTAKELDEEEKKNKNRDKERDSSDRDSGSSDFIYTRKFKSSILSIRDTLGDIFSEVKGQINGVGWNIEYIRNILMAKFGSDLEIPLPDGDAKKSFKKRGFIGRQVDSIKKFLKTKVMGVTDWVGDKVDSVRNSKIGQAIIGTKNFIGKVLGGGWDILGGAADLAVGTGKAIWKGGGLLKDLVVSTVGGIKDALGEGLKSLGGIIGDLGSILVGALKDTAGAIGSVIVGGAQAFKEIAPELAKGSIAATKFVGKGLWEGAKWAGKGLWGGIKWAGRGLSNIGYGMAGGIGSMLGLENPNSRRMQVDVMSIRLKDDIASLLNPVHLIEGKLSGLAPMTALPVYIAGGHLSPKYSGKNSGLKSGSDSESNNLKDYQEEARQNKDLGRKTNAATKAIDEAEDINRVMKQLNTSAMTDSEKEAIDRAIQIQTMKRGGGGFGGLGVDEKDAGGGLAKLLGAGGLLSTLLSVIAPALGMFTQSSEDLKVRNAIRLGKGLANTKLGKRVIGGVSSFGKGVLNLPKNIKGGFNAAKGFGTEVMGRVGETAMKSGNKGIANWGTKVLDKATTPKVVAAAGEAVANKGIVNKIISACKAVFDSKLMKKLGGTKVAKHMPKLWTKLSSAVLSSGKLVGSIVSKVFSRISIGAALAIYDAVTGMGEAANMLDMRKEDVTWKHRAAAGVAKVLAGFLMIIPDKMIADMMLQVLLPEAEYAKVEDSREALELRYQKYVAEGGTLEYDQWNNQENRRFFSAVLDAGSWLVGGKRSKKRKEYKETMAKVGDTPTGKDLTAQRTGIDVTGVEGEDPSGGFLSSMLGQISITNGVLGTFGVLLKNMISVLAGFSPDVSGINTALGSLSRITGTQVGSLSLKGNPKTGGFSPVLPSDSISMYAGLPGMSTLPSGGGGGSKAPYATNNNSTSPWAGNMTPSMTAALDPFGLRNAPVVKGLNSMITANPSSAIANTNVNGVPYYSTGNAVVMSGISEADKRMACGPLAVSMVISAYTGKYTPPSTLVAYAKKNYMVASDGLIYQEFIAASLKTYGIEAKTAAIKYDLLYKEMGQGSGIKPVVLLGQYSDNGKVNDDKRSKQPFTEAGHYVVVVEHRLADNRFKILDPFGVKTGWYLWADISKYIKAMYFTRYNPSGVAGGEAKIQKDNKIELPKGWNDGNQYAKEVDFDVVSGGNSSNATGTHDDASAFQQPSNIDELLSAMGTALSTSIDKHWGFVPPGSEPFTIASATSNVADYTDTGSTNISGMKLFPMKYDRSLTITSKYGPRTHPTTGVKGFHNGIDLAYNGSTGRMTQGSNCYAVDSGKVAIAKHNSSYGNYIVIVHKNYSTLYAHLDKMYVAPGAQVAKGQHIGLVGNTGTSTGPHLHFEVRLTTEIGSSYWNTDAKGKYTGAVDPVTFTPSDATNRVADNDSGYSGETNARAKGNDNMSFSSGPMPMNPYDDIDSFDDMSYNNGPMAINPYGNKTMDFNSKLSNTKAMLQESNNGKSAIRQMGSAVSSEDFSNAMNKMCSYLDAQVSLLSKIANNTENMSMSSTSNTKIIQPSSSSTPTVEGKTTRMQEYAFNKANAKF
jgi:murein DD-endopeptidase MepM/ murein hydrolase activator NlpD